MLARAANNESLPDFCCAVFDLFIEFPATRDAIFQEYLQRSLDVVFNMLLVCTEKDTRACFAKIYLFGLVLIRQANPQEGSLAFRIIDCITANILEQCSKNWTRFEQFWEMLLQMATLCPEFEAYFVKIDLLKVLLDLYLGAKSPLAGGEERQSFGSKLCVPQMAHFLKLVRLLIIKGTDSVSEDALRCINTPEFYSRSLKRGYDGEVLGDIVAHFARDDVQFSQMIAEVVLKGLNELEYEEISSFYLLLDRFLSLEDSVS